MEYLYTLSTRRSSSQENSCLKLTQAALTDSWGEVDPESVPFKHYGGTQDRTPRLDQSQYSRCAFAQRRIFVEQQARTEAWSLWRGTPTHIQQRGKCVGNVRHNSGIRRPVHNGSSHIEDDNTWLSSGLLWQMKVTQECSYITEMFGDDAVKTHAIQSGSEARGGYWKVLIRMVEKLRDGKYNDSAVNTVCVIACQVRDEHQSVG